MSGHFFGNKFEINKLFFLYTMHKSNQHDVGSEHYFRIRLVLSKVTGIGQTPKITDGASIHLQNCSY